MKVGEMFIPPKVGRIAYESPFSCFFPSALRGVLILTGIQTGSGVGYPCRCFLLSMSGIPPLLRLSHPQASGWVPTGNFQLPQNPKGVKAQYSDMTRYKELLVKYPAVMR
mmetsp:Transcript_29047/g.74599  ORF Transcript_29047/g.74599 Transcript_29047/m.74599 type:complete len:110 (-) Transcript_29047:107-436(-)